MTFIETPIFTSSVNQYLSEEEYRTLQMSLFMKPTQGALIPGAGGLRKLRVGIGTKGKRGGLRVIYYRHGEDETIYLLLIYPKGRTEDLTRKQLKILSQLVREEFK
jgi:mRNA-degrading endonuclease RelE of RelBE toxin-antitoxin system